MLAQIPSTFLLRLNHEYQAVLAVVKQTKLHFSLPKYPKTNSKSAQLLRLPAFQQNNLRSFSILTPCNERYDTRTTTLSSRNQRTALMLKIIKLYTRSHNYSNTLVRRTTNSLNPTMVFDNMQESIRHIEQHHYQSNRKSNVSGVLEKDESFKWGTFHQDLSYHSNEMTPCPILHKTD